MSRERAGSRLDAGPRRGAALIVVLAFAALLAGLAATAMRDTLSGARAAAVFADLVRADELGRAATDIVIHQLAAADSAAKRGGALRVRLTDADILIEYQSESARVDANQAPLELISALLAAAGADTPVVAEVAGRIAQFRQEPGKGQAPGGSLAPSGSANGTGPKIGPTGGSVVDDPGAAGPQIQQVEDVVRVWGLPAVLARRVLPALTVQGRSKTVDPTLAGRLVLSALMGGDEARTDDYIGQRSRGFTNAESALAPLPVPARAFASFVDADAVRAVARVTIGKRFERRYEFVLAPLNGAGQGVSVSSWRPVF